MRAAWPIAVSLPGANRVLAAALVTETARRLAACKTHRVGGFAGAGHWPVARSSLTMWPSYASAPVMFRLRTGARDSDPDLCEPLRTRAFLRTAAAGFAHPDGSLLILLVLRHTRRNVLSRGAGIVADRRLAFVDAGRVAMTYPAERELRTGAILLGSARWLAAAVSASQDLSRRAGIEGIQVNLELRTDGMSIISRAAGVEGINGSPRGGVASSIPRSGN